MFQGGKHAFIPIKQIWSDKSEEAMIWNLLSDIQENLSMVLKCLLSIVNPQMTSHVTHTKSYSLNNFL